MKTAMLISGGVDSAVATYKLLQEGHDLHLFYIRIGMKGDAGDCSAEEDIEMCSLIAHRFNLPFDIVSLQDEYWEYVMGYTLDTVKKGLTPHPDIMCNKIIKFGFFEQNWGKDFDLTATGHYADTLFLNNKKYLATVSDKVKDQTDFLAQITYSQLEHIIFPLGQMPKEEVRKLAMELNLPNATRKDSQGICFLGKINYSDFLESQLGVLRGDVVDIETQKIIGKHNGYWFYTIGQRKGLGLSGGPWFVIKKDIQNNILYVSKGYETPLQYGKVIQAINPNWISGIPENLAEESEMDITFKTRHTPLFSKGKLYLKNDNELEIISEELIQGIAPGQYVVIYSPDNKICYGSAMINLNYSNSFPDGFIGQ